MKALLDVKNVSIRYHGKEKDVQAVRDVSFSLLPGDSLGIVGESGSGKSTLAMAILGLLPKQIANCQGDALFAGQNLLQLNPAEYRPLRWQEIAVVFQKSMNSLSPVHRVSEQVIDIYHVHHPQASKGDILERFRLLLSYVNLPDRVLRLYPHEMSGGMLQRVSIALSLLFQPKLLILDEATTALDVVTQGQILEEIMNLEKEFHMSRIMITHDMSVVSQTSRLMAILYAGELLETGPTAEVLSHPRHPYTQGLIRSFPSKQSTEILRSIPGHIIDLSSIPPGCIFSNRCSHRMLICEVEKPPLRSVGSVQVACHREGECHE